MNPADPECKYEVIGEGKGDTSFFFKSPVGEPILAPFWHTKAERASTLRKEFIASVKSVGKAVSELDGAFLAAHNHGSSVEARKQIKDAWLRQCSSLLASWCCF
jgi:hypothetical protein